MRMKTATYLSEEGLKHAEENLEFLAAIFESVVFASLGLSLFTFAQKGAYEWSPGLSLGMFVNVVIFRFVGTFSIYLLSLVF